MVNQQTGRMNGELAGYDLGSRYDRIARYRPHRRFRPPRPSLSTFPTQEPTLGIGCVIRTVRKFANSDTTGVTLPRGLFALSVTTVTIPTLRLTVNELAQIMLDVVSLAEETTVEARTIRNSVRASFSHKLNELA